MLDGEHEGMSLDESGEEYGEEEGQAYGGGQRGDGLSEHQRNMLHMRKFFGMN